MKSRINTMELHKPLKDQEIVCLAERMSPMEFDKIATDYLDLTKVNLAQCKETAGRNCIAYMTKSLIMWRDEQPQNEARQILYSRLMQAADTGLLSRTSFRFLVAGDSEEDAQLSKWEICMKNLKKVNRKCRSYPTLILTTVAIVPMLDDFINWSHSITLDKMTTTFVKVHDMNFPAASNMEDLGILILSVVGCLVEVSGVLGCCLWWNATKHGGQPLTKRKIDLCRFSFVLLMAALLLITVCSRVYLYYDLRHFKVQEEMVANSMKEKMKHYPYDVDVARSWDKLQFGYECCGIHNLSDWRETMDTGVPDSCCKVYKTDCGKNITTTENIFQNGCLGNFTFHINEQVRYQTTDWQTTCLAIVVCLVLCLIKTLSYSRKEFCGNCLCRKTTKYKPLENEEFEEVAYQDDVEPNVVSGSDTRYDHVTGNDNRYEHCDVIVSDTDELQYDDSDICLLINDNESLNITQGVLNIEYSDDDRLLDLD